MTDSSSSASPAFERSSRATASWYLISAVAKSPRVWWQLAVLFAANACMYKPSTAPIPAIAPSLLPGIITMGGSSPSRAPPNGAASLAATRAKTGK